MDGNGRLYPDGNVTENDREHGPFDEDLFLDAAFDHLTGDEKIEAIKKEKEIRHARSQRR